MIPADTGREAGRSGTSGAPIGAGNGCGAPGGPDIGHESRSVPAAAAVRCITRLTSAFTARLRHVYPEPVFLLRSLCWLRRRHRWRVLTQALQTEYRHQTFRIRCRDCGVERRMTGVEIQYRRVSGDWEREL